MDRAYYSGEIKCFCQTSEVSILGAIVEKCDFSIEETQKRAWLEEIALLQKDLSSFAGYIAFEFSIPRMGKRIDVVLIIDAVIFVLEFKVGEEHFRQEALDQVFDYALDLQYFHEKSHNHYIVPMLLPTNAKRSIGSIELSSSVDKVVRPLCVSIAELHTTLCDALVKCKGSAIEYWDWEKGRYYPTPTIIEAAMALYGKHEVLEITRNDAGAKNLASTSDAIFNIISRCQSTSKKAICFVTGVPGAGKTLVGLNTATKYAGEKDSNSVFLSGNGPLVSVLREALARDEVSRMKKAKTRVSKKVAKSRVALFVQNVHHFRDEYLRDSRPPFEHIALFDEAQRAWNVEQTSNFMKTKKKILGFTKSEPEFLISCMDRHPDWATIICLVGGGQEINTGEAGIAEWIHSVNRSFPHWDIFLSPNLHDSEYSAANTIAEYAKDSPVRYYYDPLLHLSVSMRSYRSENVSRLVKEILDIDTQRASATLKEISPDFPFVLTRSIEKAKSWLKEKARGSERYGIVVSSQAQRLKPHAIDIRTPVDPVHWFLDGKEDVRSSFYLEDVATEFQIQGLELDWSCVVWDADFRYSEKGWTNYSFIGNKWTNINKSERKLYQKNAYRVLLTRARQGMVIVVPNGDADDPTRAREYYDPTFEYLMSIGIPVI
jgi:hypothetical protein